MPNLSSPFDRNWKVPMLAYIQDLNLSLASNYSENHRAVFFFHYWGPAYKSKCNYLFYSCWKLILVSMQYVNVRLILLEKKSISAWIFIHPVYPKYMQIHYKIKYIHSWNMKKIHDDSFHHLHNTYKHTHTHCLLARLFPSKEKQPHCLCAVQLSIIKDEGRLLCEKIKAHTPMYHKFKNRENITKQLFTQDSLMPWWIKVLKDAYNWNTTSNKLNPENALISISTNGGKWCFVTQMNIIPNALPPYLTLCSQTTTFVISWAGCFAFNLLFFCAMSVIVANVVNFGLFLLLKSGFQLFLYEVNYILPTV